ncbi:MAG: sulfatase [Phycisphaerae bacterium]|nr:sulfatase-like hydrolase/transferase [Phycisphaerae bacterium]NUQ47538.1 sulfatase [Phycisphaerae bacterium]
MHCPRLIVCFPAVPLLLLASCRDQASLPPRPDVRAGPPIRANLLFISLDTARADHLGCYGYDRPTSPNIDALAAESHVFDQAYTVMATTLPSHTSMFTSLNPAQTGITMNALIVPPEALTLAERLKAAGFSTGAFIGAVPLARGLGLEQGFDVYESPPRKDWKAPIVRRKTEEWLAAQDGRFFCFVHMFEPHTPYEAPVDDRRALGVSAPRLPPGDDIEFLKRPAAFTPPLRAQCVAAYDAEIRSADREIGALLDRLTALGLREKTIIVFVSDHGETLDELIDAFGYGFDHGEFLHMRELRIPFVLWLPPAFSHRGPARHAEQVSVLDLMPTLLELLGVRCEPPFEGRSLVPLLGGGTLPKKMIVAERHGYPASAKVNPLMLGGEAAVLDGRWHFVCSHGRADELFDLDSDPGATANVVGDHPEYRGSQHTFLRQWYETFGRPLWGVARAATNRATHEQLTDLGYMTGAPDEEIQTLPPCMRPEAPPTSSHP